MKEAAARIDSIQTDEFRQSTEGIIEDFLEKQNALIYPHLKIRAYFHADRQTYDKNSIRAFAGPVFTEKTEEGFTMHLCRERMQDLPLETLQGWLTRHAALCIPKLQADLYAFNFLEKILPIMPVTGLATNHIIEVVTHLERALQQYLVTESLINLGYGPSQCYYYFHRIENDPEDVETYHLCIPYEWTRSLFLGRIFENYMGILVLERHGVRLSNEVKSHWQNVYQYVLPRDMDLMHTLFRVPQQQNGSAYCDTVVEMFKVVRDALLEHDAHKPDTRPLFAHWIAFQWSTLPPNCGAFRRKRCERWRKRRKIKGSERRFHRLSAGRAPGT